MRVGAEEPGSWPDLDSIVAKPIPRGYDEATVRRGHLVGIRTRADSGLQFWSLLLNIGIGGLITSVSALSVLAGALGSVPNAAYASVPIAVFVLLTLIGYSRRERFVKRVAVCDGKISMVEELIQKYREVRRLHRKQLESEVLEPLEGVLSNDANAVRRFFTLHFQQPGTRAPDPLETWPAGKTAVDWGYKMEIWEISFNLVGHGPRQSLWDDAGLHFPVLKRLEGLRAEMERLILEERQLHKTILTLVDANAKVPSGWAEEAAKALFSLYALENRFIKEPSHNYQVLTEERERMQSWTSRLNKEEVRTLVQSMQARRDWIATEADRIREAVRLYRCYPGLDEDCTFTIAEDLRAAANEIPGLPSLAHPE